MLQRLVDGAGGLAYLKPFYPSAAEGDGVIGRVAAKCGLDFSFNPHAANIAFRN